MPKVLKQIEILVVDGVNDFVPLVVVKLECSRRFRWRYMQDLLVLVVCIRFVRTQGFTINKFLNNLVYLWLGLLLALVIHPLEYPFSSKRITCYLIKELVSFLHLSFVNLIFFVLLSADLVFDDQFVSKLEIRLVQIQVINEISHLK